jgi:hypothetical protein
VFGLRANDELSQKRYVEDDRASREVFVTEHIFLKYNILDPHGGVASNYSVMNHIAT